MKVAIATVTHFVTVVFTATSLATAYGVVWVYVLAHVDPKFGAAGTVELIALIAFLCSVVAALGSGSLHFVSARKSTPRRISPAVWTGVIVGAVVAATHNLVLSKIPLVPGIRDWPQYCAYFVVVGCLSHWLASSLVKRASGRAKLARAESLQ